MDRLADKPLTLSQNIMEHHAVRVDESSQIEVSESLLVEEPLQISINGKPFTVTMRTPGDDEALIKGLLFTEGVVRVDGLSQPITFNKRDGYTEANVTVPPLYLCENLLHKRTLAANASCGVCGKQDIKDLSRELPAISDPVCIDPSVLHHMLEEMRSRQWAFEATGGSHAASAWDSVSSLISQHEDIGRHNAVDKVIGDLVSQGILGNASLLFVSGRISFEIVTKTHAAGIPILCAVSAPSSLAVKLAVQAGITLIAFCRNKRFTVYANPERVTLDSNQHVGA